MLLIVRHMPEIFLFFLRQLLSDILKYIFVLISPHAQCFIPEVNTKLIEYPVVADFCALLLDEQCNCGILTYLIENTDYILNG